MRPGGSRPEGLSASGSGVPLRNRAGEVFQGKLWLGSQEEMSEGHEVKALVESMVDQQQASTEKLSYLLYVFGHSVDFLEQVPKEGSLVVSRIEVAIQ